MGPRGGGQVAAVNGGAARSIGDHQAVAEELGEHFYIRGFTAAGTGAGEFEQRAQHLHGADVVRSYLGAVHVRKAQEEIPIGFFLVVNLPGRDHGQGLVRRVRLALGRADVRAERTARTVVRGNLDDEFLSLPVRMLGIQAFKPFRSVCKSIRREEFATDNRVRADGGTLAALDAEGRIPFRQIQGQIAFFVLGRSVRECAVHGHLADRDAVAFTAHHLAKDVLYVVRSVRGHGGRNGVSVYSFSGCVHLVQVFQRGVHGGDVFVHHFLALLGVGFGNGLLDVADGFIRGNHAGQLEEAGLHNHIDAAAHARFAGHGKSVNRVELDVLVQNLLLHAGGQRVPELVRRVRAVHQESGAVGGILQEVEQIQQGRLVQGQEVCLGDQVCGFDRTVTEAQVGNGGGPRFLGVIHEVALHIQVRMLADDLDGILIGAHGAVGAEAEEHGPRHVVRFRGIIFIIREAGAQYVVVDADGEMILGSVQSQVVIDALDHGGGEFLGGEAVASAYHLGHAVGEGQRAVGLGVEEGLDDVLVERFSLGAGFLGAVQHGDFPDRSGEGLDEFGGGEWAEQAHLQHTYLGVFPGHHGFYRFFHSFSAGSHQDNDAFGVRSAGVIHQMVGTAGKFREFVHGVLDNSRSGFIETVDRFTSLEVNVRVLGSAAQNGSIRSQGSFPEGIQPFLLNHAVQGIVRDVCNLADFVGRAEPVKEIDERNAGFQCSGVGNSGEVRSFLSGGAAQHGPSAGAGAHHVAVVAKNGKGLVSQGPGGYVEHGGSQFPCDFEHVRDHQQEPLGCGERSCKRSGLEGAVNGACRAAFTLHFHYGGNGAPQVLPVDSGPAFS